MGDIVKEFNMIDLLGLMLPGAFLTIIFGQELGAWATLRDFWGTDNCTGVISVIILVGGYFVGMLLHEMGDLLEKILWLNPLTNPRMYAALATGLNDRYNELCNGKNAPKDNPWKHPILEYALLCLGPSFVVFFVFSVFLIISDCAVRIWNLVFFAAIYILILVLTLLLKNRWNAKWNTLQAICKNDSYLMYIAAKKRASDGEMKSIITSKLDLFEGFRTMVRNIFVALCILVLYAKYFLGTQNHDSVIISAVRTITNSSFWLHVLFLTSAILLLRYWHFSYLKYKYCYEEIVFHSDKDDEKNEKSIQCPICSACAERKPSDDKKQEARPVHD